MGYEIIRNKHENGVTILFGLVIVSGEKKQGKPVQKMFIAKTKKAIDYF